MTAEQHPSSKFSAYHWNARNPIRGLGRDEFDYTDFFGSRGALRSVEFYRDAQFTAAWTSNHEIGHQWADYWDWTEITEGIERKGWGPGGHTPLPPASAPPSRERRRASTSATSSDSMGRGAVRRTIRGGA